MKIAAIFFTLVASACTLYQSQGRKLIEDNTNGVSGLEGTTASFYYNCQHAKSEPEFLKEPAEVVATPFDSEKFTTLYDAVAAPHSVIIYTQPESDFFFCHVTEIRQSPDEAPLTAAAVQSAAVVGVDELKHLMSESIAAATARP